MEAPQDRLTGSRGRPCTALIPQEVQDAVKTTAGMMWNAGVAINNTLAGAPGGGGGEGGTNWHHGSTACLA